jgi:hypothetical protein
MMGGGSNAPSRGENSRELLLCVLPVKESEPAKTIEEIKEEFPNLDVEYIYQEGKGQVDVPKGKNN